MVGSAVQLKFNDEPEPQGVGVEVPVKVMVGVGVMVEVEVAVWAWARPAGSKNGSPTIKITGAGRCLLRPKRKFCTFFIMEKGFTFSFFRMAFCFVFSRTDSRNVVVAMVH
jgi:hypothetical protein